MDALDMVYVLLEHDPDSEMLAEYRVKLEATVKAECEAKEADSSDSDSSSSSSSSSDSEGSEEEAEVGAAQARAMSDDEAEKKDDDIVDKYRHFEAEGFKQTDDGLNLVDPESEMTETQKEKYAELRDMFNDLRAEVADKNEEERELWDVDANTQMARDEMAGVNREAK
jgi:hypothetical protein